MVDSNLGVPVRLWRQNCESGIRLSYCVSQEVPDGVQCSGDVMFPSDSRIDDALVAAKLTIQIGFEPEVEWVMTLSQLHQIGFDVYKV